MTAMSATERTKKRRAKNAEQGLKAKEFYLTDDEHADLKRRLKKLRENK